MKKKKILALAHKHLVPPTDPSGIDLVNAEWKMEYDIVVTLQEQEHKVELLGVDNDLQKIHQTLARFQPNIVFNLMESFDGVTTFDQNLVSYLELLRVPYTGCNPRGMTLARDKSLSKKLLAYHKIPVPESFVVRPGQKVTVPKNLTFPLIVKSLFYEASVGISQASVVKNINQLKKRVQFIHATLETSAIVEQFIDGRELYVGVIGNEKLQVLPVWEMVFRRMADNRWRIATEQIKSSTKHQKKYGVTTYQARLPEKTVDHIQHLAKQVYQVLSLSGYARIDLRLDRQGRVFVLEANPNPNLSYGEDFAESAEKAKISYEDLLERIMKLGLQWDPERTS